MFEFCSCSDSTIVTNYVSSRVRHSWCNLDCNWNARQILSCMHFIYLDIWSMFGLSCRFVLQGCLKHQNISNRKTLSVKWSFFFHTISKRSSENHKQWPHETLSAHWKRTPEISGRTAHEKVLIAHLLDKKASIPLLTKVVIHLFLQLSTVEDDWVTCP